jgi:hypothetical protein
VAVPDLSSLLSNPTQIVNSLPAPDLQWLLSTLPVAVPTNLSSLLGGSGGQTGSSGSGGLLGGLLGGGSGSGGLLDGLLGSSSGSGGLLGGLLGSNSGSLLGGLSGLLGGGSGGLLGSLGGGGGLVPSLSSLLSDPTALLGAPTSLLSALPIGNLTALLGALPVAVPNLQSVLANPTSMVSSLPLGDLQYLLNHLRSRSPARCCRSFTRGHTARRRGAAGLCQFPGGGTGTVEPRARQASAILLRSLPSILRASAKSTLRSPGERNPPQIAPPARSLSGHRRKYGHAESVPAPRAQGARRAHSRRGSVTDEQRSDRGCRDVRTWP